MLQQTKTTFPVPASATLHLPWQGSWKIRASKLAQPVTVQGAHLPLIAWQDGKTWRMARFETHPDDAVWDLCLHHAKDKLSVTLIGLWKHKTPRWLPLETFPSRQALLQSLLTRFPAPTAKPRAQIKRHFILDIHNVKGELVQTFDQVSRFLKTLDELNLAQGSLIYLPGWAGLYDGNYPEYKPSPAAGGDAGLARLAKAARKLGAVVSPHFNHWGVSCRVADQYKQFAPHQLIDRHGKKAGWPGIFLMDMSWPLDYIDPALPAWIDHFSSRLSHLESLGVNGAYLDQVAPPLGDNWRASTRAFTKAIRARHPSLVLGSESFHADVIDDLDYAQLWGPVWSAMPLMPELVASPFLADAVRPWQTIVGHLGMFAPYPCKYVWTNFMQLAKWGPELSLKNALTLHRQSNVVPTIRLVATSEFTKQNQAVLKQYFL